MRGRLWRRANPDLLPAVRESLVSDLMRARRAVKAALTLGDAPALAIARAQVHAAKVGLGERGPVWWADETADMNRRMVANTPYAAWHAALDAG